MLFMDPVFFLWMIPLAIAMDLYFGDPPDMPVTHPVRRIGHFLDLLEPEARKLGDTRAVGTLCALAAVGLTGAVVWLLTAVLPGLWAAFALYFAYAGLAFGSLLHTSATALEVLEHGTLPEAQTAVGQMVSRDTTVQDRPTLYKSLAESLSENMSDAVTGPLFWLMLTGPVGLWAYKAASTMDSMWGYKTPRWKNLGWAGARLDDALAFVPARLGAFFLYLAARLEGNLPHWPGWATAAREAGQMESPNSGWPMAAAAWTQHAGMGGPTLYFGAIKHKPLIGPQGIAWDAQRIRGLIRQTRLAGLLAAGSFYLAALAFYGSVSLFSG
jgi:adenosylcobinamide-phosphate synthase